MLVDFTVLLAGFSIFSAVILLFAYLFFLPELQKSTYAKIACTLLLGSLAGLQYAHYLHLSQHFDALNHVVYLALLLLVPPFFCFFSRYVLFPDAKISLWQFSQLLPVVLLVFVPFSMIPPIAFFIGTIYTFWFANIVYRLRNQHSRFKFEMFFFGLFALMALVALGLGLAMPYIDHKIFYITYAMATGLAMFFVLAAMLIFPEMLNDIQVIADMAYSNSKLGGIDVQEKQSQLESLIAKETVYQNEKLSLSTLSEMLGLSSHQLSELINTQYGYGFSRFVREKRIAKAKALLVDDPKTSILAISIMTGFQSQSNFYSAFRDIVGESPGSYRKKSS